MEPPPTPPDFAAMFAEMCPGDPDAQEFCHTILAWVHLMDDMDDGETAKWPPREIARTCLRVVHTFAGCPFYRRHQAELWPMILNSAHAYVDSHNLRHDLRMREVLKTQYQEIFFTVARLVGGWEHMGRMTEKYRLAPA